MRPNGIIGKERVDGKEQKLQEGITQISAEQGKGNMEVRDVKVKESKMARFEKPVVSKSEKEGANAKDSKLSEDMNSRTMSLRSKSRSSPLLTRKKASSFDDTKPREHPLQRVSCLFSFLFSLLIPLKLWRRATKITSPNLKSFADKVIKEQYDNIMICLFG